MPTFPGTPASETIIGTSEDDIFYSSGGQDLLDGAGGYDRVVVDYSSGTAGGPGAGGRISIFDNGLRATFNHANSVDAVEMVRIEDIDFRGGAGNDSVSVYLSGLWWSDWQIRLDGGGGTDLGEVDDFGPVASANGALTNGVLDLGRLVFVNFERFDLVLTQGNDTVTVGNLDDVLEGNSGDDTLNGMGGDDQLEGGWGADVLDGGDGNDRLYADSRFGFDQSSDVDVVSAGAGNDYVSVGYGDSADGGSGTDSLSIFLRDATAGLTIDLAALFAGGSLEFGGGTIRGFEAYHSIYGSEFDDSFIVGDAALPGDGLFGFGGNDSFVAGSGADRLFGGSGNDTIRSGAGNDSAVGDDGDDLIYAEAGDDLAYGGNGVDTIHGGDGNDTIFGSGDWAPDGGDSLYGEAGNDIISGDFGNDLLQGGDGNDQLNGGVGDDTLEGGDGDDLLNGDAGADAMRGGVGNDSYRIDDSGDVIVESASEGTDEVQTALAALSIASFNNVENLTGTSISGQALTGNGLGNTIRGNSGDDRLSGGDGNDVLYSGTGIDALAGDAGNDAFYFGESLGESDDADGGAGTDTLAIQGHYAALALGDVANVEVLLLLPGGDRRFVELSSDLQFYNYNITTRDSNVSAGGTLTLIAGDLRGAESLTFNGSAETDGHFRMFAGRGTDTLGGGAGNDGFFFGASGNLTGDDRVAGGAGVDAIALRGNYVGATAVLFQNASFTGVEVLTFLSGHSNEFGGFIDANGFDYDVTVANGNVAAGQRLDIIAGNLRSNESARIDARAELDGSVRIITGHGDDILLGSAGNDLLSGGAGADLLDGGAGADVYVYRFGDDSRGSARDSIVFGTGDRIDLALVDANQGTVANEAFDFVGSAAFSGVAGQLRLYQTGGQWIVEGDVDGDAAPDLVIAVDSAAPLTVADFIL